MDKEILDRIEQIKLATEPDEIKKCLCPFFKDGGYKNCITCPQDEDKLIECQNYYMDNITLKPMKMWCPDFDKIIVNKRDKKIKPSEVVGIGISCDNCYMYDKCPLYESGMECGIEWGAEKPETPGDVIDFLISTQYERVKRSSTFEKVDGGVPDVGLSGEIDRLRNLVFDKTNLGKDRISINVEASSSPAGGGGILAKLFGGGSTPAPALESAKPTAIDIDAVEVKEPEKVKSKK